MFAIKFKTRVGRRWYFATSRGEGTLRKIHAALFDTKDEADRVAARDREADPDLEIKIVEMGDLSIRRPKS